MESNSSFSVQKLAENLAVLNQNAKNIISALYNMKYLIQSDQFGHIDSAFNDGTDKTQVPKAQCPRVLGGDQQLSVISKLFIKKYPEHPSNELSKVIYHNNI